MEKIIIELLPRGGFNGSGKKRMKNIVLIWLITWAFSPWFNWSSTNTNEETLTICPTKYIIRRKSEITKRRLSAHLKTNCLSIILIYGLAPFVGAIKSYFHGKRLKALLTLMWAIESLIFGCSIRYCSRWIYPRGKKRLCGRGRDGKSRGHMNERNMMMTGRLAVKIDWQSNSKD